VPPAVSSISKISNPKNNYCNPSCHQELLVVEQEGEQKLADTFRQGIGLA
jgi:hypothetical protein